MAYGLPYFNRFPGKLFESKAPRLLSDETRSVLEEAVPSRTDVTPANPGITKERFNVAVLIEANDLLFTLRGDNTPTFRTYWRSWAAATCWLARRCHHPG